MSEKKDDLPQIDDLPDLSADDLQAMADNIPEPVASPKTLSPAVKPPATTEEIQPPAEGGEQDGLATENAPEDEQRKQQGFDAPGIIDDAMRGASVASDLTIGAALYPFKHGRYHLNQAKDLLRKEKVGQETFQERIKRKQFQNMQDHLKKLAGQRAVINNLLDQREQHFGEYWPKYQRLLHSEAYKKEYPDKKARDLAAMTDAGMYTPIIKEGLEEAIRVEDRSLADLKMHLREHANTIRNTSAMSGAIEGLEAEGDVSIMALHESLDASLGSNGIFARAQTAPSLSEENHEDLKSQAKETLDELKKRLEMLLEALMAFANRVLGRG